MKTQKFNNGTRTLTLKKVVDTDSKTGYTHFFEIDFDNESTDNVSINMNQNNNLGEWLEDNCDIEPSKENIELLNNMIEVTTTKEFNLSPSKSEYETKITSKMKSRLMKRAHYLVRTFSCSSLSEAMKVCWDELKSYISKERNRFESKCNQIKSLYNVELHINEQLNRASLRGEDVK